MNQGFQVLCLTPCSRQARDEAMLLCALCLITKSEALKYRCGAHWPASQPPRILHILDFWKSSFSKKKKKKSSVFPLLGFGVAMLKDIFCALPEQVWIKTAASLSPTCPDLYYPSEVFGKKKEEKEKSYKLTSAISSFLPMLCLKYRACFHPLYAEESDSCSHLNDLSDSIHIIKL